VFPQLDAVVFKFCFSLGRAVSLQVLHFYSRWQCVLRKCEVNEKISLGCRCSYSGASNYMDVTRTVLQVPVALWPQYCEEREMNKRILSYTENIKIQQLFWSQFYL
jgi:hypothetical protein